MEMGGRGNHKVMSQSQGLRNFGLFRFPRNLLQTSQTSAKSLGIRDYLHVLHSTALCVIYQFYEIGSTVSMSSKTDRSCLRSPCASAAFSQMSKSASQQTYPSFYEHHLALCSVILAWSCEQPPTHFTMQLGQGKFFRFKFPTPPPPATSLFNLSTQVVGVPQVRPLRRCHTFTGFLALRFGTSLPLIWIMAAANIMGKNSH